MSNIRRRAGAAAGGKETNSDSATMAQEHIHENDQGHTSEHTAEEKEKEQVAVPQEDVDKYRGPIGWCRKRIYQYELTTGLYMLDRWEKVLFSK